MYSNNLFSNYDKEQIKKIFLSHILDLTTIHESDKLLISLFTANTHLNSKTILDEATAEFIGLLFKLNVHDYNILSLDSLDRDSLKEIANGCGVTLDYLVSLAKEYFDGGLLESKLSDILVGSIFTLYTNVFTKKKYLGLKITNDCQADYLKDVLNNFTFKAKRSEYRGIQYKIEGDFEFGSFKFKGDLNYLSMDFVPLGSKVIQNFPDLPVTYLKPLVSAISYFYLILSNSLSMGYDGAILTYDKNKPTSLRFILSDKHKIT